LCRLGSEFGATFGAAAGQNLPSAVSFHASAETGLMSMFDFRGLIRFLSHGKHSFRQCGDNYTGALAGGQPPIYAQALEKMTRKSAKTKG